jgi:hypothetical protein
MKYLFSITVILFSLLCQSQNIGAEVDRGFVYKSEHQLSFFLGSGSFGINGRYGQHRTAKLKRYFEADLSFMRHPKEVRTGNPFVDNARRYVYGKLNSFTNLRLGTGFQKTLFTKDGRKGVEIRTGFFAGPSIAILKPVYLEIGYPSFPYRYVRTEKYNPDEHFSDNIYGRAPIFRGIDELSFIPGGYGKFALTFEYSNEYEKLSALEIGATIDLYPKKIPIMALTENYPLFVTFYVSFIIGKKYINQ